MQNLCYLARRIQYDVLYDRAQGLATGNAARDAKIAALYPKNDSGGLEEAKADLVEAFLAVRSTRLLATVDAFGILDLPACGRDDISACRAEAIAAVTDAITTA